MIIPKPFKFVEKGGKIKYRDKIQSDFSLPLYSDRIDDNADIHIIKDETVCNEGYFLSVAESGIEIKASSKTGAYYALKTLERLTVNGEAPCCEIEDKPRFKWRGLHLDESRHFFGEKEVKRFLDLMFDEKLNVFHWHLTDDQGWRIEIKKYPRLTEFGSKRSYSQIGGWGSTKIENEPVEGFYTQEQVKDIIDYAAERGITIVPEIDFPAHSLAAIASYPELACFPKESDVPGYFGGTVPEKLWNDKRWNKTLCCGKDSTFKFVYGVLDEVCELFPSEYIHMGGDEAPTGEWKRCPECQKIIKDNTLKNEHELQAWFENKLIDYLDTKGKRLIGWNEIAKTGKVKNNVTIQYWTPKRDKAAEKFVNQGGSVIMSNHQAFYFDMPYATYPLKNTYNFRPEHYGIHSENQGNILGVEGELWTEWIADINRLEMMAFPRVQALAEVGWSQGDKDFDDFKRRLDLLLPSLEEKGINYARDEVSMPKNELCYRANIKLKFHNGDPYLETELNRKYGGK